MSEKSKEIPHRSPTERKNETSISLSDWFGQQDDQALQLMEKKDPMNEVTKTYLILSLVHRPPTPVLGPPRKVKRKILPGSYEVRDTLKTPKQLRTAALQLAKDLREAWKSARTGAIANYTAAQENTAMAERIKTEQTVASVDIDPRTLQYLRLISLLTLGTDGMKKPDVFFDEYFRSLAMTPAELLSVHTFLHHTIVAIDGKESPFKEFARRLKAVCEHIEGSTNERLPYKARYFGRAAG